MHLFLKRGIDSLGREKLLVKEFADMDGKEILLLISFKDPVVLQDCNNSKNINKNLYLKQRKELFLI